jgi:hypothetical protein
MAGVLSVGELTELLDRFGVKVKVDLAGAAADGVSPELVTARLAHALVGVVEAPATRAEDAPAAPVPVPVPVPRTSARSP